MKTCPHDTAVLTERPPEATSGKPDYKCWACGRVYKETAPGSATVSASLEIVYDPEWLQQDSASSYHGG
jgi:hypothetical protein